MSNITQVAPVAEMVTAILVSRTDSGENFDPPVLLGIYPSSNDEVWMEIGSQRVNINVNDVLPLCREFRRARGLAMEQDV